MHAHSNAGELPSFNAQGQPPEHFEENAPDSLGAINKVLGSSQRRVRSIFSIVAHESSTKSSAR
jgi:hypothetical protein